MARISVNAVALFLTAFLTFASAWDINNDNDRLNCQSRTRNPLAGCDQKKTVFVDFVSANSKFKTVQSGMSPGRLPSIQKLIGLQLWHHCQITLVSPSTGEGKSF
jgi:hypothetical protein